MPVHENKIPANAGKPKTDDEKVAELIAVLDSDSRLPQNIANMIKNFDDEDPDSLVGMNDFIEYITPENIKDLRQDTRRIMFSSTVMLVHEVAEKQNNQQLKLSLVSAARILSDSLESEPTLCGRFRPKTSFSMLILNHELDAVYVLKLFKLQRRDDLSIKYVVSPPLIVNENVNLSDSNHIYANCVRAALRCFNISFKPLQNLGYSIIVDKTKNDIIYYAIGVVDNEVNFDDKKFKQVQPEELMSATEALEWIQINSILTTEEMREVGMLGLTSIRDHMPDQGTSRAALV